MHHAGEAAKAHVEDHGTAKTAAASSGGAPPTPPFVPPSNRAIRDFTDVGAFSGVPQRTASSVPEFHTAQHQTESYLFQSLVEHPRACLDERRPNLGILERMPFFNFEVY